MLSKKQTPFLDEQIYNITSTVQANEPNANRLMQAAMAFKQKQKGMKERENKDDDDGDDETESKNKNKNKDEDREDVGLDIISFGPGAKNFRFDYGLRFPRLDSHMYVKPRAVSCCSCFDL